MFSILLAFVLFAISVPIKIWSLSVSAYMAAQTAKGKTETKQVSGLPSNIAKTVKGLGKNLNNQKSPKAIKALKFALKTLIAGLKLLFAFLQTVASVLSVLGIFGALTIIMIVVVLIVALSSIIIFTDGWGSGNVKTYTSGMSATSTVGQEQIFSVENDNSTWARACQSMYKDFHVNCPGYAGKNNCPNDFNSYLLQNSARCDCTGYVSACLDYYGLTKRGSRFGSATICPNFGAVSSYVDMFDIQGSNKKKIIAPKDTNWATISEQTIAEKNYYVPQQGDIVVRNRAINSNRVGHAEIIGEVRIDQTTGKMYINAWSWGDAYKDASQAVFAKTNKEYYSYLNPADQQWGYDTVIRVKDQYKTGGPYQR